MSGNVFGPHVAQGIARTACRVPRTSCSFRILSAHHVANMLTICLRDNQQYIHYFRATQKVKSTHIPSQRYSNNAQYSPAKSEWTHKSHFCRNHSFPRAPTTKSTEHAITPHKRCDLRILSERHNSQRNAENERGAHTT